MPDIGNAQDKGKSRGDDRTGTGRPFSSTGSTAPAPMPLFKTVRDLEMVLAANWKEISTATEQYIGRHRDQLENRTGLEVAVLAL